IYALDKIGGQEAIEPLIKGLNDPHWEVRSDAATALGKIGDERAVVPLLETLKDENKFVRKSVAKALENLDVLKNNEYTL
ncbi:MAG: HEAT repeat domain-containing protein, partial [Thermoplasmatales archaeon]